MIFRIVLPIININVRKTGNKKLELLLVKDRNQLSRYNIVESYDMLAWTLETMLVAGITL